MHMDDALHLVALAREHHALSRYSKLPFIGSRVWAIVRACIEAPDRFGVVLEMNNTLSGYCGVVIEPYMFADDLIAREIALYVSPAARSMVGFQTLVCEVEKHARERGARTLDLGVSSPREVRDLWRYGKVYEHIGYELHSVSYSKEVGA